MASATEAGVVIPELACKISQLSSSPNEPTPINPEGGNGFENVGSLKVLYDSVRSNFPYFDASLGKDHPVFMENAGGSQCPGVVIDAITNYMRTSYAQLGAGHEISNRADATIEKAHEYMKTFMNAHGFGEVVFGPSTSQLVTNLSQSYMYSSLLREGDEVIIHEANHEANVAPWLRMAGRRGISVKWWKINHDTFEADLNDLEQLLSPRTRIVAVPHVSNLLGEILDLERVVKVVKARVYEHPVRVIADGVAYAPHRAVDVAKWGVDWYVFSCYKVYGPHMAVLFGSNEAFTDVIGSSPNWDFQPADDVTKKFEVGGVCHEACAGVVALNQYFGVLATIGKSLSLSCNASKPSSQPGAGGGETKNALPEDCFTSLSGSKLQQVQNSTSLPSTDWEIALKETSIGYEGSGPGASIMSTHPERAVVEAAYETIVLLELPLQEKLLAFLRSRPDVIILGPKSSAATLRVPTFSFIHVEKNSAEICRALLRAGFAVRNGNMYCFRLASGLAASGKLTVNSVDDGVVRISMVHYNTPLEVSRLIACLQAIL